MDNLNLDKFASRKLTVTGAAVLAMGWAADKQMPQAAIAIISIAVVAVVYVIVQGLIDRKVNNENLDGDLK